MKLVIENTIDKTKQRQKVKEVACEKGVELVVIGFFRQKKTVAEIQEILVDLLPKKAWKNIDELVIRTEQDTMERLELWES